MTIGIPGWMVGPNSFGVTVPYVEFCRDKLLCDDLRILSPDSPIFTDLDLLILSGGADVNPSRYGEAPSFHTDKPDIIKEWFDVQVLPRYIEHSVPVFGICRGLQSLAVHFGGKLNQDMYHETNPSEKPWEGVHHILSYVNEKTQEKVKVNSRHHQSVYIHSLKDTPVVVTATHSTAKHHVEAIMVRGYKVAGVQYHPEDLEESSGVGYALKLINTITKK